MSTSATAPIEITSWVLGAIAVVLTGARLLIRWFVLRNLYWDDLMQVFALVCALVIFAIYTTSQSFYLDIDPATNELTAEAHAKIVRNATAEEVMFWCGIWAIKFAFLFFYRLIFKSSPSFTRFWWIILSVTFLSFWPVLAGYLTWCGGSPTKILDHAICIQKTSRDREFSYYIYSYCINVATDLAIMILPIPCVLSLQMSLRRKLGVLAMFGLGLVIIIFETLRLVENLAAWEISAGNQIWYVVEIVAAIIASSLPTFAVLVNSKSHAGTRTYTRARGEEIQPTYATKTSVTRTVQASKKEKSTSTFQSTSQDSHNIELQEV